MKKLIAFLLSLTCIPLAFAAGNDKEVDRIKDAGTVLKEILERTAERVSNKLTNQPEVQAEIQGVVAEVYSTLGQDDNRTHPLKTAPFP